MANSQGWSGPSRRTALVACVALVAAGAVVRAVPCGNQFWLDEIWTYALVQRLTSASGVFTQLHHSNSHHLNTLAFYWLGDQSSWAIYRIPSLIAGVGSVVLAIVIAWRRGRGQAVIVAVLFSSCFALIQFSSEARGYAPAVFFSLAAFLCLEADLARRRGWLPVLFGVCVVLAFLSQLTSLFFLAGATAYSLLHAWQRGERGGRLLLEAARIALLPAAAFAVLYWVDLRQLLIEGGEVTRMDLVTATTVGYALGLPIWLGWAVPFGALAAALLVGCLARLFRSGDPVWLLHAVTIVVAPAVVLLAMRPDVIAARYFLVGIAFYLLALGDGLAHLAQRSRAGARLVAGVLCLFVLGNAFHIGAFLRHGRGGYLAAFEEMAGPSESGTVRLGSDHDFRTFMALNFYIPHLPPRVVFEYYRFEDRPKSGLDWLIRHGEHRDREPEPRWMDQHRNVYELTNRFEKTGVSGFYWDLYRATGERKTDTR